METSFTYTQKELEQLKQQIPELAPLIDRIGPIRRRTEPDIERGIAYQIIGQQISARALDTIWNRLDHQLPFTEESLREAGIPQRKADAILAVQKMDLETLKSSPDNAIRKGLTAIKGIGDWTVDMVLLFTFNRMDILSEKDFGIRKGLEVLYGRPVTKEDIQTFKQKASPLGSLASLYLWELAKEAQ